MPKSNGPKLPGVFFEVGAWGVILFCVGLLGHQLFFVLTHFTDSETLYFNGLRLQVMKSFANFQLPVWSPLVGPGGSSVNFTGVNPWEFKTILYTILGSIKPFVFAQWLLIACAYGWMISVVLKTRQWILIALGILIFLNLDAIPYQIFRFGYNSLCIGFPLVLASIIGLELDGKRSTGKFGLLFFLGVWLAFQGTQFVLWVVQFQAVVLFSIVGVRLLSKGSLFRHPNNRIYLIGLVCGVLANSWQLYWLFGNAMESSRLAELSRPGLVSVLNDFFRSFLLSAHMSLLTGCGALVFFFKMFSGLRGKIFSIRRLFHLVGFIVCFKIADYPPTLWVYEDSILWGHMHWLHKHIFVGILVVVGLWVFITRRKGNVAPYEFPCLALVLHYFLFENAHWDNFGARQIEFLPKFMFPLITLVCSVSLFSKDAVARRVSILGLTFVYFMRCHATIVLMRLTGVVWYNQRDAVFVAVFLGLLFFVGIKWMVERFPTRVQGLIASVLLVFFAFTLRDSTFRSMFWNQSANPDEDRRVYHQLFSHIQGPIEDRRSIISTSRGVVSGSLMSYQPWQVNVYDSLVPSITKNYLSQFFEVSEVTTRPECRLPFIWFPNNIIRILKCDKHERALHYQSLIGNRDYRLTEEATFQKLGVRYLLSAYPVSASFLVEVARVDHRDEKIPYFLYRYPKATFSFLEFDSQSPDCKAYSKGLPVQGETNYFTLPILKRKFQIHYESRSAGCLRLGVNFSSLWSLKVNGRSMSPIPVDGPYMGVPIEGTGPQRIELVYLPKLSLMMVLSLISMVAGAILLWRQPNRV